MAGERTVAGISLPLGDTHFAHHLTQGPLFKDKGTYQFAKIERALAVVPASKRCVAFDVGGHIGLWSRVLAAHFERVIALEPLPALHPHFRFNTADCPNVRLVECAASNRDDDIDIVTVAENSGNGHVYPGDGGVYTPGVGALVYRTQSVRLDALNMHDVGFIKIDVEGFEYEVIEGAFKTIHRDHPVMVVEQKPDNAERYGRKRMDAVCLLESWGYRVVWEKSGDFCLAFEGTA